ncbi:DUF3630 family protein [Photobacterium sanguinicancri]|uniref:Aminopeptidase n=1 Tax=Photobacterium sanguinicancri TaxID=875932 RepID=A0ABX4G2W2_9GAMM|nr:DUF3630 family protein [Photobacterium sanguinicancri]MDO6500278.1 DUF3630 family protein [Photobacterium sanguinicancri]OZS45434.1 aminopeptidase [Photobacterium sanguinicancri]
MSSFPYEPFSVRRLDFEHSHLLLTAPDFDYDTFSEVATALVVRIDSIVIEQEKNADLHVWLIDFEGCRLLLKGEHYSGALWIEAMSSADNDTLAFIASMLPTDTAQYC